MSLTPHQQALIFTDFLSQPGNTVCADCSEPHPSWASVNNSVLVCFQCAGIHRSLGTEISQIKSGKPKTRAKARLGLVLMLMQVLIMYVCMCVCVCVCM
jgi:hypothetical protein